MLSQNHAKGMELLKRLGVSEGEGVIYLRLLSKSEGESVEHVVTSLGVHGAEDSLKGLVDKGLVKISSNKVEVVQPRTSLQRILDQRKALLHDQISEESTATLQLEKLLEPIYWEGRMGIRPEEIIEPLRDLSDMELNTARILGHASQEVLIFAETFGWYGKVRPILFQAHDRQVAVRILMMVNDESTRERAKELEALGIQVRHCVEEWYPVRGTLVDGQELVFLIWATKKHDVPRPVYYRPNYTKNGGLIRIFRDAFLKRWEEGKPI